MKKSTGVLGVVVILGAAYLGATWYVGKETQKTVEDLVAQANERIVALLGTDAGSNPTPLTIDAYQRHFFSSDVTYTLRTQDSSNRPIHITLNDHLQHGPFPLQALQSGDFMPMLAYSQATLAATPTTQAWVDSQKGGSPLRIETRVGFGGSGHSHWVFAPTDIATDDQKISFSGGSLTVDFSNSFQDSVSTSEFASFKLDNARDGKHLHAKNIKVNTQNRSINDQGLQSQSSATIDSLVIGDGAEAMTVEQVDVNFESQQNGTLLDASVNYGLGRIAVGDIDLGSLSLAGRAQQLDIAALTALATDYDAIAAKHGGRIEDEQRLSAEEEAVLRDRLIAVLASDPTIAIEPLLWKNAKGESKASLQLALTGPKDTAVQTMDQLMVQGLKQLKFDLGLSRAMLIQAFAQAEPDAQKKMQMEMLGAMIYDQYVGRLQAAGLVKVSDDIASASVLYESNALTVNGQAMTVPEFMQRVFSVVM